MRYEPVPAGIIAGLCRYDMVAATGLGECEVTTDLDGLWLIVRADPVIAVSGILLRDWHDALPDCVSLTCAGVEDHIGDVIMIEGAAQRAIYVITRVADSANDVFEARWPD